MTKKEAFQSLTAYKGDSLLNKILLDRNVTGIGEYSGSTDHKKEIDLCLADLYFYLSGHPKIKAGSFYKEYTPEQLRGMAEALLQKHDEGTANISGKARW